MDLGSWEILRSTVRPLRVLRGRVADLLTNAEDNPGVGRKNPVSPDDLNKTQELEGG